MKRVGTFWAETLSPPDEDGDVWAECWFINFTLFEWHGLSSWRCCMANYDGVPYFLFIVGCFMFKLGKTGYLK